MKHAILSASSSKQWLNCPPSARLQEQFPNETSPYAEEGTYLHSLCEYKVKSRYLHEKVERPTSEKWDTPEAEKLTDVYYDFVAEAAGKLDEPLMLIEQRLDYSHIAPQGFGTGDMILIDNETLHIIDFKGGGGVFVDARKNSQMMLYALGALAAYGYLFDVKRVKMSIVQPRLENISTYECSKEELTAWGESIKPVARLAFNGEGEQKPGDWCRFCRAKAVCKARRDEALAEFDNLDKPARLVPVSELIKVFPKLSRIKAWADDVIEYLTSEAIDHGLEIEGYTLTEGKSKRIFTDIDAVARTAEANGYEAYKKEPLSLTEFEKIMGKEKFTELLGGYVVKPKGKLTLRREHES